MFLLPPSPRPFGLFAEKAESITDDLRVAQELERQIIAAYWEHLIYKVRRDLVTKGEATYESPFPLEYIVIDLVIE